MTETASHKHSYPPDGNLMPRPCTCGTPPPDPYLATLRDIAEHYVRPLVPLMAAELEEYAGRLESALRNAGKVTT